MQEFYSGIINAVVENIRMGFTNQGYDEHLLESIKQTWRERLQEQINRPTRRPLEETKAPAPLRVQIRLSEEVPELPHKRPAPEPVEPPRFVEDDADTSEEDEDDEEDEMAARFNQYKAEATAKEADLIDTETIRKELEEDGQESEGEHEPLPSDGETNIAHPEADDEVFCMYDKVNRKGPRWKLQLKYCILQTRTQDHHLIRTLNGDLDF